ncbi:MAG: hypothetical protein IJU77_11495 [Butyrivibrio sp.]|nr:hypothetical protein [Butyrivibrio sp.]
MYVKVSQRLTSDIIEIHEYAAGGYGAPGKRRKKKKNISPEIKEKHNRKARERRLQKLILMNFQGGWHIILRYPKDDQPKDYEEAAYRFGRLRENISRELKKYEIPFKYIVVTEQGKREKHFHHHIIVESLWNEGIDMTALIRKKWEKYGTTSHSKLYEEGNYEDLAKYLAKSETKEEQPRKEHGFIRTYKCSRNLKQPEIISKENYYGDMREPEAPPGWFVDIGSLIQGINPYTGKKYQRYFVKSTPEKVIEMALEKKEISTEKEDENLVDINLYIKSKVVDGKGDSIYMLECIKKDGTPYIKAHHAQIEGNKEKIVLFSILSAIKHITVPARINIFTQNTLVRNAIKNGWAKKWQKENWKNSSGKLIENSELWSQLLKSEEQHKLTAALKRDEESHGWSLQQLDRIADEYYKRKG